MINVPNTDLNNEDLLLQTVISSNQPVISSNQTVISSNQTDLPPYSSASVSHVDALNMTSVDLNSRPPPFYQYHSSNGPFYPSQSRSRPASFI